MKLSELKWSHPCGCGDTPDPRAEVKTGSGQFRIKKTADGYLVQRFFANGAALNKDADGVPVYESVSEEALEAMLS